MTIKAIETEYNGYRFRSRLEARWAVFFDALGVKYEYEPDGFVLPSGRKYLPDFRVKCHGKRGVCAPERTAGNICPSCEHNPTADPYLYQDECNHAKNAKCSNDNGQCGECDNYSNSVFDLYIEVKGEMSETDARRIREFGYHAEYNDDITEVVSESGYPVLIVGNIPPEGHSTDSYAVGAYDGMDGTDICPFNYELIDGDCFAAYPAASHKRFYLFGDDSNYIDLHDEKDAERAYRIARQTRFEHGETPTANQVRNEFLYG